MTVDNALSSLPVNERMKYCTSLLNHKITPQEYLLW